MKNIKINEYIDDGWQVEFIYSPYFEMICSLHVLVKPEHHLSRLSWARGMKERMDKRIYEEILLLGNHYFQWCTAMDFYKFAEGVNDLNVIACLDIISEIDIIDYIYIMLEGRSEKIEIAQSISKKCYIGEQSKLSDEQSEIFHDSESFRRRFLACLKEYYYLYFEKELRFIEPLLIRKLKKQSVICENIGIKDFTKSVHTRIEVSAKAFLLHKYTLFTIPFEAIDTIKFMASSFADPHLLVGLDEERVLQFTLMVNLEKAVEEVPFDLFITMKALGDETRLKILRCIYKKIDSTQAIAKEINITEAGISKHLKIMQEAGLLFKKRDGNYIRYVIEREMIDRIPMDIYQYLDKTN